MNRILLPLAAALSLLLQGCFFTGVESTPKITAGDVRREETPLTREDTFLTSVADAPPATWRPGKEFVVTDPRISRVFDIDDAAGEALTGRTIRYAGMSESAGVTGSGVTDILFTSPSGEALVYRVNRPLARLADEKSLSVPFTIQRDMAEAADRAMRGLKVYTLTGVWRDPADNPVRGIKFVPVTIDSVSTGNALFPLKVAFTDANGHIGCLFIYPGAKDSAPRTFGSVFSFGDPRKRYPSISDENWELITRGRVTQGMTTLECRLALGNPKEVNRGATQSYLRETWSYENGRYLLFEDGLLKTIR